MVVPVVFKTHGDLVYFEISSKSFRRRRPGILLSVSEPMVILCTLKFLLSLFAAAAPEFF